jgi:hypothetical protein
MAGARTTSVSDRGFHAVVALGALLFLGSVGVALALHRWLIAIIVAAIGANWLYRRVRQAGRRRARLEAAEAERRSWTELEVEPGDYSVVVQGFQRRADEGRVAGFVSLLPWYQEHPADVDELIDRVRHVAAQPVAEEIARVDAERLRAALAERGALVEIVEHTGAS